ncbi:hypothetical protein PUN28_013109 [Cardiocondyla obscurior]|uniref:Uncharacterized protein n=1 Tax=Cardiocondyla obscurior TaxID=286306 RepID=A0AAW2F726_9HYME
MRHFHGDKFNENRVNAFHASTVSVNYRFEGTADDVETKTIKRLPNKKHLGYNRGRKKKETKKKKKKLPNQKCHRVSQFAFSRLRRFTARLRKNILNPLKKIACGRCGATRPRRDHPPRTDRMKPTSRSVSFPQYF